MDPFAPRTLSPGEIWEEPQEPEKPQEWVEDRNVTLICPDCQENPPNLIEEFSSGDTVCESCGRVLADRIIDTRSEWRTFSNDDQGNDDPSRVGDAANPLLNGSQLQTEIGAGDGGLRVRELARAQNKSTHNKENKALMAAFKQISTLCEASAIPNVVADTAKHLYKLTDDDKVFKGKSSEAIVAGCIFIACRQNDVGRSFKEIYNLTNISKKEIGRSFKALEAYLAKKRREGQTRMAGNGAVLSSTSYKVTKTTDAAELIGRACNKLNITKSTELVAREAAARVSEFGVAAGRSPLSITGACIYLISHLMNEARTPKDIGQAVEVSDGTIRTAYKLIYQDRDKVILSDWLGKRGGDMSRLPPA